MANAGVTELLWRRLWCATSVY